MLLVIDGTTVVFQSANFALDNTAHRIRALFKQGVLAAPHLLAGEKKKAELENGKIVQLLNVSHPSKRHQ